MQINALLSGFSPVAISSGGSASSTSDGAEVRARQEYVAVDVFEQGQPWKNMAKVSRAAVAGTPQARVAQAYTEQAGAKQDFSAATEVAVKTGGKTAEATDAGEQTQPAAADNKQQVARQEDGIASAKESPQAAGGPKGANGAALTQAERLQVAELDQIDTKVRAHEMAHLAAAGSYATGGASFQYAKGPDGKEYAVGGEVGIDTGKEASPEATISKMQTVRAAALAPADPSAQDQKVAARASQVIVEASQELQMIRLEQAKGKGTDKASVAQGGEKPAVVGGQSGKNGTSDSSPSGSPTAQKNANAIMPGLMRPASQIHIAV